MNTTQLIAAVRRLWMGPTNSLIATDETDILAHSDEIISDEIMTKLVELQEDYCVVKERVACISGVNNYQVPIRSFNGTVRHVAWEVSAGAVTIDLDWIDFSKRDRYRSNGYPTHFWFENDDIAINGDPSGNLIIAYAFKPNYLVTADNYRIVSLVDTSTNEVTVSEAVPSDWVAGNKFDIIDSNRSGMPRYFSKLSTNIAGGTVITMDSEIAGAEFGKKAIQVGDYIALENYAARPMIPENLHSVVAQGVCHKVAQAQVDTEAFQIAFGKFKEERKDGLQLLDKRARVKKTVINYNSRFRRGRVFRRRML